MGLYEQLERTKLRFIAVCESLLARGELGEEEFEQILVLLDKLEELKEEDFLDELRKLTDGAIDLQLWDRS